MSTDHPLQPFASECLVERDWDARSPCGAVRRRYQEWAKQNSERKIMGHVQFSREMRKFWSRKGCSARQYYVGIELVANEEEEEEDEERSGEEDV